MGVNRDQPRTAYGGVDQLVARAEVVVNQAQDLGARIGHSGVPEQVGTPIGAHDMLIAAHALALGFTIVTDKEKEFARVRGLARENWLR